MNKTLKYFLLGAMAFQATWADEDNLCSTSYAGASCVSLKNSGNGYSKKISENVEQLFINNKKNAELTNMETLFYYYTLPSSDGVAPSSTLSIKTANIDVPIDQNGGGRGGIRQSVVGPYSHLKLISTSNSGVNKIEGIRIGIGANSISPLETNLKYQYLGAGTLDISIAKNTTSSSDSSPLIFSGLIYMGNGSSLSVDSDKPIEFKARMQNSITYPQTKYYLGDEIDDDSFAFDFYYDGTEKSKDKTSAIAENINLDFSSSTFSNQGYLQIVGAGSEANIKLTESGNAFSNGTFNIKTDYLEHNNASIIDALNNDIDKGTHQAFTENINWKEGRISIFDYATLNITGNVHNDIYGNILLVDGGVLNITGDFKNNGWILSGAIDTRDFGYINVSGKSTLGKDTQIALISSPDKIILGNKAYLILKSKGKIEPESTQSPLVDKNNIHLFNAQKNNGKLINVSQSYLNSNLNFDTTLSNDKTEFYITLRPTDEAKAKSVEDLIKEASSDSMEQIGFQQNKQSIENKKIALIKLLQQESINGEKLQEYKSLAKAEFMNQKLSEIEAIINTQKQELMGLKSDYDKAIAEQNKELEGKNLKDQAPIRKKYNSLAEIKNYRDLENSIRDQEYALEDIKKVLPEKNYQEGKIKQLEDINTKYQTSNLYNPSLLDKTFKAANSYVDELYNGATATIEGLKFLTSHDEIYQLKAEYDSLTTKNYASFDEFMNARIENKIKQITNNEDNLGEITQKYLSSINSQYSKFEKLVEDFRQKASDLRKEKTIKQAELANNRKAAQSDFDALINKIKSAPSAEMIKIQQEISVKEIALKSDEQYQNLLKQQESQEQYSDEWYETYDKINANESLKAIDTLKTKYNTEKSKQTRLKIKPEDILSADENKLKEYTDALNGTDQNQYSAEKLKEYAQVLLDANLAINGDSSKGIKSGGTKLNEELQKKLFDLAKEKVPELEEISEYLQSLRNNKEEFIKNLIAAQSIDSLKQRKMDILNGVKNLSDELATSIIAHIKDDATLENIVNDIEKNIDNLSTQNKNNSIAKTINIISATLTQNRMTLQSNPFNTNNPIAAAIEKLSKQRYAAEDTTTRIDAFDALQEVFSEEENQTMDIWASVIGGYAQASGNSVIYGGSIGYDTLIGESFILGIYGTYAYAKSNNDGGITAKSNNAQLGLYSRFFKNHHEVDVSISHNIGFVNQERVMNILNVSSNQTADYINQSSNLAISYGYAFGIGEDTNFYLKPLIGASGAYNIAGNYEEKGLKFEQEGDSHFTLNINAALELRKYFKNGGYFYIIPGIDYLAYNSQKTITHKLGGVKIISPVENNNKIYYTALAGGEFKINKSIFGFGSLGVKIAMDEQYYNGSIGMRYKF